MKNISFHRLSGLCGSKNRHNQQIHLVGEKNTHPGMSDAAISFAFGDRKIKIAIALLVVSFVGGFGWQAIRTVTCDQTSVIPLVGTWRSSTGSLWNLRADGSGRFRCSPGEEIGFFEWRLDGQRFEYLQFASNDRRYHFQGRLVRVGYAIANGKPTGSYDVINISADQFTLQDRHAPPDANDSTASLVTFTRTQDHELEVAP